MIDAIYMFFKVFVSTMAIFAFLYVNTLIPTMLKKKYGENGLILGICISASLMLSVMVSLCTVTG